MFAPVKIEITDGMSYNMKIRHKHAEKYNGSQIEDGKGRIWGFLGEEIVRLGYLKDSVRNDTFDHDLLYKGYTIDVKSKIRKDIPRDNFDGIVNDSAMHQNPDFYIFVSIIGPKGLTSMDEKTIFLYDFKEAYLCGFIESKLFKNNSKFIPAKTIANNKLKYNNNCWELKYSNLKPMSLLLDLKNKEG